MKLQNTFLILLFNCAFLNFVILADCRGAILAGDSFLAIRVRTDKYKTSEGLESIEYAIYKFTLEGAFKLRWKVHSTPCMRTFLDEDGKVFVALQNVSLKEPDQVAIKFYSQDGLVNQFKLKDLFEVDILETTDRSNPLPKLKLFSENAGILNKEGVEILFRSITKENIKVTLDKDEQYFYYITSQKFLIIHKISDGKIILKSVCNHD